MKDYYSLAVCAVVVGKSASFSVAVLASGRPIREVRLGLVIKMVSQVCRPRSPSTSSRHIDGTSYQALLQKFV